MSNAHNNFDLEAARTEPGNYFKSPEELINDRKLSQSEKMELLKIWSDQVDRLLDSGNEGMPTRGTEARDAELLRQIELAKEKLERS